MSWSVQHQGYYTPRSEGQGRNGELGDRATEKSNDIQPRDMATWRKLARRKIHQLDSSFSLLSTSSLHHWLSRTIVREQGSPLLMSSTEVSLPRYRAEGRVWRGQRKTGESESQPSLSDLVNKAQTLRAGYGLNCASPAAVHGAARVEHD